MKKTVIPYRILERDDLDKIDLKIMHMLINGYSQKEIANQLKIVEKTVANRLEGLVKKEILIKKSSPIIDIFSLYNYAILSLIKLHLGSAIPEPAASRMAPLPGTSIQSTPPPPSWLEIKEAMMEVDEVLFKKLVRLGSITMGTEWDLMLLITTQSREEYTKFFSQLQQKGFIEKVQGIQLLPQAGYYFDPIAVPDPEETENSIKELLKTLQKSWDLSAS